MIFCEIVEILVSVAGPCDDLPPPATEEELLHTEKILGHRLPTGLREIYKIHNGERDFERSLENGKSLLGVFYDYPFLSLSALIREYEGWGAVRRDVDVPGMPYEPPRRSHPPRYIRPLYSSPGWVTFAGGSAAIGIDFAPDSEGVEGQIITFGRDDVTLFQLAPDFDTFLRQVLEDCRRRRRNTGFRPAGWTSLYDELIQGQAGRSTQVSDLGV